MDQQYCCWCCCTLSGDVRRHLAISTVLDLRATQWTHNTEPSLEYLSNTHSRRVDTQCSAGPAFTLRLVFSTFRSYAIFSELEIRLKCRILLRRPILDSRRRP